MITSVADLTMNQDCGPPTTLAHLTVLPHVVQSDAMRYKLGWSIRQGQRLHLAELPDKADVYCRESVSTSNVRQ